MEEGGGFKSLSKISVESFSQQSKTATYNMAIERILYQMDGTSRSCSVLMR